MPTSLVEFRRPAPLVWRRPGTLQVGLDPGSAFVVEGPAAAWVAGLSAVPGWLQSMPADGAVPALDGRRLSAIAPGLAGPAPLPGPRPGTLVISDDSVLGRAVLSAFHAAGQPAAAYPAEGGFDALPSLARRTGCVVVATGKVEPDRRWAAELSEAGVPHLVVRAQPARTVVGPFVVPGRSSCLRCLDLGARDADPAWPLIVVQLASLAFEPEPACVAWAASTAVLQVLALESGATPDALGACLELDGDDWLVRRRPWIPHPDCGCLGPARAA